MAPVDPVGRTAGGAARLRRPFPAVLLVLVAVLGGPVAADGHAVLGRAEPRPGSTLRTAPLAVRIWFTEPVEAAFSTVRVVDETGRRVDGADPRVDPSSASLLRVSLRPLGPGAYRVIWRVLSVDSHVTEGEFTFRVKP